MLYSNYRKNVFRDITNDKFTWQRSGNPAYFTTIGMVYVIEPNRASTFRDFTLF